LKTARKALNIYTTNHHDTLLFDFVINLINYDTKL